MSLVSTDTPRLSAVVKYEDEPSLGLCRDEITVYDSASTYAVGTVLGRFLASGVGAAVAGGSNTGNGTMGAITVGATAKVGVYTLKIVKVAANAGDFVVTNSDGQVVGNGTVAVAFSQAGLSFTLADGATDFALGDTFTITVTGTYKYKKVEATATDGTNVPAAIFISNQLGAYDSLAITANTDTKVVAITRGKVIVSKDALVFGSTVNTEAELALAYSQLEDKQIFVETTV
jgi:hypothetical protein